MISNINCPEFALCISGTESIDVVVKKVSLYTCLILEIFIFYVLSPVISQKLATMHTLIIVKRRLVSQKYLFTLHRLFHAVDWFPTLLAAAGEKSGTSCSVCMTDPRSKFCSIV